MLSLLFENISSGGIFFVAVFEKSEFYHLLGLILLAHWTWN